jgi:hypothetical protein
MPQRKVWNMKFEVEDRAKVPRSLLVVNRLCRLQKLGLTN